MVAVTRRITIAAQVPDLQIARDKSALQLHLQIRLPQKPLPLPTAHQSD
jgi:hypothetical protein